MEMCRAEVVFAPQVLLMNQTASYLPVHVPVVATGFYCPAFPNSDKSASEDASKTRPHPSIQQHTARS
jgi:hypothetical protein